MQQILIIHGGDSFKTYSDYLESLKAKEITLERLHQKDWKHRLQAELGDDYDVLTPRFPNAQNARYEEWRIYFEKLLPLLSDGVILIGHSLGGLFLAKYLSENTVPEKVKAVMLIAAPFSTPDHEPIGDFPLDTSFPGEGLSSLQMKKNIFIYHSTDDPVVPSEDAEKYKKELPEATIRLFTDRGHFNAETFPELVDDIRSLE